MKDEQRPLMQTDRFIKAYARTEQPKKPYKMTALVLGLGVLSLVIFYWASKTF